MDKERLHRMENEAIQELIHYYDKDVKRRWKDRLKKIAGRHVPPNDCIFWDTGLLANGLMELWGRKKDARKGGAAEDSQIIRAVRKYFDRWISRGMPIYYVDDTLCGVALLRLYESTSEEKYKAGAEKMADYLLAVGEKEMDAAGSIPYRPAQKNGHIYVDSIGMMCPFLTMYGVKYGNRMAVDLALAQIKNMLKYGMDAEKGLPYHGFRYENREKYGIIGWGRAVGWLLMGMRGALYWLQEENTQINSSKGTQEKDIRRKMAQEYSSERQKLKSEFFKLLKTVQAYQRADGGFSWQLEAMEGPADSSATAMIAQALQFGLDYEGMFQEAGYTAETGRTVQDMLQAAVRFLHNSEKDGKIYHCLGECMGFSQYPQVYGAYPWSLGTALGVMALYE